jgi:cystathionine gamma-synthase
VARLEGAEAATAFASGMAAISNTLFAFLSPGDRIVSIKDSYGGTNKVFTEFLPRFQIDANPRLGQRSHWTLARLRRVK